MAEIEARIRKPEWVDDGDLPLENVSHRIFRNATRVGRYARRWIFDLEKSGTSWQIVSARIQTGHRSSR